MSGDLLTGEPAALPKRGISEETCRKFRYWVCDGREGKVQAATYCDASGQPVAQKLRAPGKEFNVVGNAKEMTLYGQHLWRGEGRRIVVTEGEIDCLSVAEATGRTWDVVSLPNGAQSAHKALSKALEWLLGYETIVLAFDDDEAGREAVGACVDLFPHSPLRGGELRGLQGPQRTPAGRQRREAAQHGDVERPALQA